MADLACQEVSRMTTSEARKKMIETYHRAHFCRTGIFPLGFVYCARVEKGVYYYPSPGSLY